MAKKLRLTKVLKEAESSKFKGKYHLGGGYYSSKEGGEAEFKSDNGKLKPLTADEKAQANKKTTDKKEPLTQPFEKPSEPKKVQTPQVTTDTQPVDRKSIQPPTEPTKKQSVFSRATSAISNWSKKEKQWFADKIHKGNSPERRSFGQAVKHKLKGAVHAVIEGAKHEVHTFKEAAKGVGNFFALKEVTPEQKKALVSVAKKVAIAAATSVAMAATGGTAGLATLAHHGSAAFLKHVAIEFIPHLTAETLAVGTARAALFAGDEEKDPEALITKFMESIMDKLVTEEIPHEILLKAIESYNAEKQSIGQTDTVSPEDVDPKSVQEGLKKLFSETEVINKAIREELKKMK